MGSPALLEAASGAMALSGLADGPPVVPPAALATCVAHVTGSLSALAGERWAGGALDGAALLGERAAIFGQHRQGRTSPGGTCKLIRSASGWIAVNLPRATDWECVPAWLEGEVAARDWGAVEAAVAERTAEELIERGRLLGLAVAKATAAGDDHAPERPAAAPVRVERIGVPCAARDARQTPLVVDLSSLWAGPLASHLLALAGARVVKVESRRRPDGARSGPAAFFDLLNAGKESVALDFSAHDDRVLLERLIERADIVIEGSRPRALAQLGIDAAEALGSRPGKVWVAITGHGRSGAQADWIGFGDDACAASGLAHATGVAAGVASPLFCGDAVADPLAGLHAAWAALTAWREGGGVLLDVSLVEVTRHVLAVWPMPGGARVRAAGRSAVDPSGRAWEVVVALPTAGPVGLQPESRSGSVGARARACGAPRARALDRAGAAGTEVVCPVAEPRARAVTAFARPLGADTGGVLARLGIAAC